MVIFTAHEAGYARENGSITCGVRGRDSRGNERYLILQREDAESPEQCELYVEVDDQSNSAYDLIVKCSVGANALELELNEALTAAVPTNHLEVVLELATPKFETLISGLREIFRGREQYLAVSKAR